MCANKYIGASKLDKDGKLIQQDSGVSREDLAFLIVIMDSTIMFIFLVSIWIVDYFIKMDIQRHKKQLIETKQFAVTISNLPPTDDKYNIDQLKADLWNHIIDRIKAYDRKILSGNIPSLK